jgi:succinoglycan biosynthesis protein ExoM
MHAIGVGRVPHITVCICTYKRPNFLKRLLEGLLQLETASLFSYSVVVVDNDRDESARAVVCDFQKSSLISTVYCVEPRQSIALARNAALAGAVGNYVALIDDDEVPTRDWLLKLLECLNEYNVDGVLGPVKPLFEGQPPLWIVRGRFHERPTYRSGFTIGWRQGITANVLLRRDILEGESAPFDRRYIVGEDQDFFRRMMAKGHRFAWCNAAVVYEAIPPARWTRSFLIRRAVQRGQASQVSPTFGIRDVIKSVVAVPIYLVALPVLAVLGHHWFMSYFVRLSEHVARLLRLIGVQIAQDTYVIE